jgi:c-di-GMP-binding flagellar brake protein YcgR
METGVIMENATLTALEPAPAVETGECLIRSRDEILRLLDLISERQITMLIHVAGVACIADTTLVFIDKSSDTLLLTCPSEWLDALDKPGAESIMLSCTCDDSGIQFSAGRCTVVDLDGVPVVGIAIPEFMWRFQRRRDMRYSTLASPMLKIILNFGFTETEAEVVDLSMSGVGAIHCDGDVKFEKGEVLCGCGIALPGVGKIAVDLAVQNQTPMLVPGAGTATRVGCQFIGLNDKARNLVGAYLIALTK